MDVFTGFGCWLGRGMLVWLSHVVDIHFFPALIRFPGIAIIECTVRSNRYKDKPATAAEYIVGIIFWLALLFGLYLLLGDFVSADPV